MIEVLTLGVYADGDALAKGIPPTTLIGRGIDAATGDQVLYGGEFRLMMDLAAAIHENHDGIVVAIEPWQVLARKAIVPPGDPALTH